MVLANAVQHVGQSVKIWLAAADLEHDPSAKKRVLRSQGSIVSTHVSLNDQVVPIYSGLFTAIDPTMDTPLFDYLELDDSQMLTGPDLYPSLFPMSSEWEDMRVHAAEPKTLLDIDPSALIVMTPTSPPPGLKSLDTSQPTNISSAIAKAPATRRKVAATRLSSIMVM